MRGGLWSGRRVGWLVLVAIATVVCGPRTARAGDDPANDVDELLAYIQKPESNARFSERVDPFSGYLHITMVDVHLPGRAGLDLKIQRYYSSNIWRRVDYPGLWEVSTHTPFYDTHDNLGSSGWQLHMGKVVNPFGLGSPGLLRDNPVVIMPDGSSAKFYSRSDGSGLVSQQRWTYRLIDSAVWEVTTIDGTRYRFEMGSGAGYYDMHNRPIAQCTRVTDVNGNVISIQYSAGRLVRKVDTGRLEAGAHSLHWDGTDAGGRRMSSGVYFVSLTAGRESLSAKTVLVE